MTEWQTKTLGEVAQIERGKFSHRPRNEPRFYGGKTPFVQTGDVTRSNGIVRTHTQTLNEDGVAISKVFPAGTILITIAANIGYTGILEFDSAAPDSLIGLTPNDAVSAEFLNFYLRTQQPEMDRMAPKGTQKNINIEFLKPWPVVVPPLPEQKKIAHILSTVQLAIEAQERIIQTTTELKKALMHKLFTEGLRHEPQKQTEIGPVPESWEVVPLSCCAVVQTGIAKGRKIDPKDAIELPYLRVANVQDGYLDLSEMKTITIRKDEERRYALQEGDVVLTEGGDFDKLGRGFIWHGQIDRCVHQNHVFAVRPDTKRISSEFLAYQSQSPYGKAYFLAVAHKTTNLACINTTKLKAFPVLLPSKEQQKDIVNACQSIDGKIASARAKHSALQGLFRTLLHELMTAKTRVHELELSTCN